MCLQNIHNGKAYSDPPAAICRNALIDLGLCEWFTWRHLLLSICQCTKAKLCSKQLAWNQFVVCFAQYRLYVVNTISITQWNCWINSIRNRYYRYGAVKTCYAFQIGPIFHVDSCILLHAGDNRKWKFGGRTVMGEVYADERYTLLNKGSQIPTGLRSEFSAVSVSM